MYRWLILFLVTCRLCRAVEASKWRDISSQTPSEDQQKTVEGLIQRVAGTQTAGRFHVSIGQSTNHLDLEHCHSKLTSKIGYFQILQCHHQVAKTLPE